MYRRGWCSGPEWVSRDWLGGVVENDLPTLIGFFEDEGEDAVGVAAVFFATVEMVFAEDYGELFVEGMDFEFGEAEGPHRGSAGVVVSVCIEHAVDAAVDLVGDEEGVRGVFVALNEAFEVAFVPCVLLGEEDFGDVQFLAARGLELIVLGVGREDDAEEECEDHGVETRAEWHGCHLGE